MKHNVSRLFSYLNRSQLFVSNRKFWLQDLSALFYEGREENNIVKETMNLLKDTCVLAFKLYILLPLFLFGSIILAFTFSSLTLNDVFSTKGAYWFVVTVVGIFSVKSKRFFIAFLISLALFLLFGGIDYIHDWIY